MTMARLRLYALTTVGGLFIVYRAAHRGNVPSGPVLSRPVWILIFVPMYAVGAWLTWRLPTHPQAGSVARRRDRIPGERGVRVAHGQPATVDQLAVVPGAQHAEPRGAGGGALALALLIGSYPDGLVERAWQRLALRCSWVVSSRPAAGSACITRRAGVPLFAVGVAVPNPYAVSWLAWLAEPALWLALNSWWATVVGVLVLCARFVAADAAGRARMRFLFVVLVAGLTLYDRRCRGGRARRTRRLGPGCHLALLGSLTVILLPVAIIYGILRHRLFDLDLVVRKSVAYGAASLLIAAAYAVIAATPGLMLGNRVPVTLAVVITIAAALAFQPLRRRLESAVSRRLFGDRVQQYQLLKNLGTTMEQTAELDELLPRLAHAVRDGIGASWVRVRLRDADGSWLDEPVGVAGEVTGESAAGVDLVRAGELVGRIDLGPRPGGYAAADLELLATVAAQATTAVANVRLATQLKEGLEELSTSRVRLIAAQDAERRRIERDLHDGIQQEVVALIAGLRLARNRLSRDQLTAAELTDLQDQAREMLRDLRELAHGIHPPVLSDNGLVAALESRVTRFPISVQILADDELRAERFSEDVEGTAYFVACESLTNVAKHAGTDGASRPAIAFGQPALPGRRGRRSGVRAERRPFRRVGQHPRPRRGAARPAHDREPVGCRNKRPCRTPAAHERPQVRMSDKLRVVIAEDNYLVREGVRRLLEDSGQVEVVACVGDARELLDAVRRLTPSAVLTDIRMPPGHHMEGIEAARAIRAEHPGIGVVVLSQHTDESYARALFNDGSAGLAYLLKDRVGDLEDLVRALNEVAAGGSVVDPLIIDTLVARQQTRASSPLASLTPRELDVLREMAQGKTNAGIEQALFLSESTVEKHVNAIFAKLGISAAPVHRRVVAVLAFLENAPGTRSA